MTSNNNLKNNKLGFSVIEIIVIVALVALAFVGVVKILSKTLQVSYITRNDFMAEGIAKEGIELVERIRNDNVAFPKAFYTDLYSGIPIDQEERIIRIDYNGVSSILDVVGASDTSALLKYDNSNYYQYSFGDDTMFGRSLTLTYNDNVNTPTAYIHIKSDVYWENKGKGYTYTIEARSYDTTR